MFWGMPWRKQKPGGRNCGSRLPPQAPGGETFGTGTFAPPWLPGGMGTRQWFVFPPNQAASGVQIQSHLLPSPTPGLSLWDPTSPSFPSFGLSKGNALAFGTGRKMDANAASVPATALPPLPPTQTQTQTQTLGPADQTHTQTQGDAAAPPPKPTEEGSDANANNLLDQTCTTGALAVPGPFEGLCDLCVGDACCYDHRNWRTRAEVRIGRVDVFAQSAVLARRVYRLTSRPDTAPAAPLDGGIVAPRPAVPSWRLRAFERRLLSKDAQTAGVDAAGDSVLPPQWFESRDGIAAAVALSDPVIPGGARRPNHRVDPNASYFQTEPASPDDAFAADGTRRTYSLEVNVARVEFHLHADMSEEDFHAQALLRMYRDVLRRERAGLIDFHQRRVAALLTNLEAALSAASRLRRPGSERRFAELVRRRLAQVEREVVTAIELRDAAIREYVNGIAALQRTTPPCSLPGRGRGTRQREFTSRCSAHRHVTPLRVMRMLG